VDGKNKTQKYITLSHSFCYCLFAIHNSVTPGETGFDFDVPDVVHHVARWFGRSFMMPARRVPRLLKAHPEVNQIGENLDMALRLHVASHHAKSKLLFALLHHESRNEGMEWTFAGRIYVGISWLHREQFASILKSEAEPWYDDAGAAEPPRLRMLTAISRASG
jgi:hypothetical protein